MVIVLYLHDVVHESEIRVCTRMNAQWAFDIDEERNASKIKGHM